MHGLLLRGQKDWLPAALQGVVHAVGAWLFLAVAALELNWQFAHVGGAGSAWAMLGWLLAPLGYLWAVVAEWCANLAASRPPGRLAVAGALPVAVFLLGWTGAAALMGNGAAPLPHIPLLNPLETGQIAVLLAIALWWRSLHDHLLFRKGRALLAAVSLGLLL